MKFVSDRMKHYWKLVRDFCVFKVLHADDPPHRLALGIAIGIFVTFLPLIGFQMVISVFFAWLCRANKVVGVPLVWISNPFTMVPIYYPCYMIGCKLLNHPSDEWQQLYPQFIDVISSPDSTWSQIFGFCGTNLLGFIAPLSVGCLLVASVLGVLAYYISLYAIRSYRLRRWGQLMPPSATPQESIEDDQVAEVEMADSISVKEDSEADSNSSTAPAVEPTKALPTTSTSSDSASSDGQQVTN